MNTMLSGKDFEKEELVSLAKATFEAALGLPFYRVIGVNATTFEQCSGFPCSKLEVMVIGTGNEYLSALWMPGCETSCSLKIKFNFQGVGGFMEIAKFPCCQIALGNISWITYQVKYVSQFVNKQKWYL